MLSLLFHPKSRLITPNALCKPDHHFIACPAARLNPAAGPMPGIAITLARRNGGAMPGQIRKSKFIQ